MAKPNGLSCSKKSARAAIARSSLPKRFKIDASGKYPGSGFAQFLCHDFTGDGHTDMAASVLTGGTAGVEGWVLFRANGQRWQLASKHLGLYNASIRRTGSDIVETDPVYKENDPNCCPSGGYGHRQFHWKNGRLVVVRTWHTKKP